jgi:hypothetical protein
VITGFNTEIEHDGVVYHVQTEDKGLDSPLILSLVYSGGAILASKRSWYEDLIAAGFNEEVLAEKLKRQHRLICAAILAGRLDELKLMGARDSELAAHSSLPPDQEGEARDEIAIGIPPAALPLADTPATRDPVELPGPQSSQTEAYSIHDPRRQSPLSEIVDTGEGLRVSLLDEQSFQAGDFLMLRIMVSYRSGGKEKPKAGVQVSAKILGTTFRPQVYSLKTERDGVAAISVQIPPFRSGRAAILVRAVADGDAVEIRRVIRPTH